MNKNHLLFIYILFLHLAFSPIVKADNIVRPWRSTTEIVKAGESFEAWFNADAGQSIDGIELRGPFNTVECEYSVMSGEWEYDPLSKNTYNKQITILVPSDTPAERYDLVLQTSAGEKISHGGVKVVKDFQESYYVMHISDGHIFQNGYDPLTLLGRKTEMIKMANIIGCEIIIETGDNMYNVRNHPEREVIYFQGNENDNILGMADATGATFITPGDHEGYAGNAWENSTVEINADFVNDYWGLQNSCFKYGNGRFMLLNNAWDVSKTSGKDHQYQTDDAVSWLGNDGAGGNFFLTAGHCYDKMHEFVHASQPLSLVLAGDKHHIRTNNPYPFDDGSPAIAYVAGSIRDHFEFNLFKINNTDGSYEAVSGTNAVVEVLAGGNQDDRSTWQSYLTLSYEYSNNGTALENTATLVNQFGFSVEKARVRFVMPKDYDFMVSDGVLEQHFLGDEFQVYDVSVDLPANSTVTVSIGDADLCPDDPDKTEPGNCGCGIEEGTCINYPLTVNNASGGGSYYPYEQVFITADEPVEGHLFDKWVIESGSPFIADINASSTDVRLETGEAVISATYKEILLTDEASFKSQFIPPIGKEETVTAMVTMKNTGTSSWTKTDGYILKDLTGLALTNWSVNGIELEDGEVIEPDQTKTFEFQIQGPSEDGFYPFQWQMQKNDEGFGEESPNQLILIGGTVNPLEDCEDLSGWNTSGTLSLNSIDKKQGEQCFVYEGNKAEEYKKKFAPVIETSASVDHSMLEFWYFVSDASLLQSNKNQFEIGSGGVADTNEFGWTLLGLRSGWNYIRLPFSQANKIGNPDLKNINWLRLYNFKDKTISTKLDGIILKNDVSQVGIEDIVAGGRINIFPNPVKSKLYIGMNLIFMADVDLRLVNLDGQQVINTVVKQKLSPGNNQLAIETDHLPKGVYLLQLMINNSPYSQKVLVQ